jgi:hypothetical protein
MKVFGCMPAFLVIGHPACHAVFHHCVFAKKNLDVGQE